MKAKEEKMPRRVRPYKLTSTGKLIDDALEAVERENTELKNVLNKNYTQLQIAPANFSGLAPAKLVGDAGLIDLYATIPFQQARKNSTLLFARLSN